MLLGVFHRSLQLSIPTTSKSKGAMKAKDEIKHSRRKFLKLGFFTVCALAGPVNLFAGTPRYPRRERSLSFYNTHTHEWLRTVYWADGKYKPDALKRINFILRDHRSGSIRPIHPQLLDALHDIRARVHSDNPFHIISGYRTLETNRYLRRRSCAVASNSFHLKGEAIDFRLPDCGLHRVRHAAMNLKAGGVGFYPGSDFIHVDIGPIRFW
jgi:uncharacterized protein YcbK (DUF882 family)